MMDQTGKAAMVWELNDAWPSSLIINAQSGKESVEELVISHEGVFRK